MGYTLEISAEAKDFIAEKGYDINFGARPLHRAIQKHLEDPLAEEILNMHIKTGDTLLAILDKETSTIKYEIKKAIEETPAKTEESTNI
jgi:ATP-dependent Clp protease ATP-binding subunit ClpC